MGEWFPEGPITVLFSDVEGSTDLRTERGDAAAHRILRSHEEVVRRCVAAHDGREVKALGDGFMVAFTSVRKALACAVAIQQGLEERNVDSPGEELRVRVGVNTGEVVVEGDDVYGQAVNAAARIASRAKGGEILISEIVRQLAGSGPEFVFVDRGRYRLKGFPDRWHLYGVVCDTTQPAEPGAAFARRTPFVGRKAERAELRQLIAQVKGGTGALVMIGGEPGVGKTRLAEELAARCAREEFQIFVGQCHEMAGAQPYIPVVEAYEQALSRATSPQAFRQFLADEAPEIARLVPKLRQLCPDIPPPLDLPPEQERRYLFNSVWEVLARAARVQPVLLVLDDLHWADEPTMLLVEHLAERVGGAPVLMIGLYRDSELDAGRPLSRTFEELTRRRLARRMPLRRLAHDGVAQLLQGLAGQEAPPQLVDVLYSATEGNPFFAEEVFKHLAEEGRLFDQEGRFRTDLSAKDLDVPEGVRMVVGARLRRLGEEGPKVLGTAAVLGRVFSFELLQMVEECPEERLLDILEDAERARLIFAVEAEGEDRFIFAHELIRQTVLGELLPPRRRRLHARAAEALERVHAAALEPQAATIAHHLLQAGQAADPERTFRYLCLAGRWALETAAFEEALTHLEAAASRMDAAGPTERADLLFRLGTARRTNGQWTLAIETWKEAIDAYEALGDVEAAGRISADAAYSLAWASRWEEGAAIAQRGIDLLGDRVSATRSRLLAMQGMVMGYVGVPFEVGDALLSQALALADDLGDQGLRGSCLLAKSFNRYAWMHGRECAEAGLEAAELLRAAGSAWEEATVLGITAQGLLSLGRFGDARNVIAYLKPLAERVGHVAALLQCPRIEHGMVGYAETGDLDALEAFARRDLRFATDNGMAWVSNSHGWLGLAFFFTGDWDKARQHLETAAELEPPGRLHGCDRALLFEFRAYAGERDAALAMVDADDVLPVPGQPNGWGQWMMLLAAVEGLYVLDERDRAASYYDLVLECIERTQTICASFHDWRLLQRRAGIAAMAGRSWDDAEFHFRTALRQAEELPHLPEQAHTRRFFARMLFERDSPGDRAEATRMAAEAADLYRRMGMPRHFELAAGLLNSS